MQPMYMEVINESHMHCVTEGYTHCFCVLLLCLSCGLGHFQINLHPPWRRVEFSPLLLPEIMSSGITTRSPASDNVVAKWLYLLERLKTWGMLFPETKCVSVHPGCRFFWNSPKLCQSCVIWDSGCYMAFKPVLAHSSCVLDIAGFGEIGEEANLSGSFDNIMFCVCWAIHTIIKYWLNVGHV